jgi:hypothetical protein
MFGMALRTYNRKTARMSLSRTEQGRSLWEAVLRHIEEHGPVLRGELLRRFHRDDESIVRSVAADLVESGLVQRTGRDEATRFQAVDLKPAVDDATTPSAERIGTPLPRTGSTFLGANPSNSTTSARASPVTVPKGSSTSATCPAITYSST